MLARNDKIKKRSIPRYVSTFHFGNDTASEQKVNFSRLPIEKKQKQREARTDQEYYNSLTV